jgi:hypothetical protein
MLSASICAAKALAPQPPELPPIRETSSGLSDFRSSGLLVLTEDTDSTEKKTQNDFPMEMSIHIPHLPGFFARFMLSHLPLRMTDERSGFFVPSMLQAQNRLPFAKLLSDFRSFRLPDYLALFKLNPKHRSDRIHINGVWCLQ